MIKSKHLYNVHKNKIWSWIKEAAIREKMLKWKGTILECKQILCNIRCTYTLSSYKVVTSKIIK